MTQYNQATLKTFFQTNDVPTGNDYANFIDSCINAVDTAVQTIAGTLNPAELVTPRVSATNGIFTGGLRVDGITSANNITIFGTFSANLVNAGSLITASAATIFGSVSANVFYSDSGYFGKVGIVSAAGTAQGTAAVLTNVTNRGKGVVDGTTTGFTPMANRAGLIQYLFNEGVSANLWPPVGGTINGLAVNAAFPIAASAMITIVHLTASAMAAK